MNLICSFINWARICYFFVLFSFRHLNNDVFNLSMLLLLFSCFKYIKFSIQIENLSRRNHIGADMKSILCFFFSDQSLFVKKKIFFHVKKWLEEKGCSIRIHNYFRIVFFVTLKLRYSNSIIASREVNLYDSKIDYLCSQMIMVQSHKMRSMKPDDALSTQLD